MNQAESDHQFAKKGHDFSQKKFDEAKEFEKAQESSDPYRINPLLSIRNDLPVKDLSILKALDSVRQEEIKNVQKALDSARVKLEMRKQEYLEARETCIKKFKSKEE